MPQATRSTPNLLYDEPQPITAAQELVHGLRKGMSDRVFYEEPADILDGYVRTLYDAARRPRSRVEDVKASVTGCPHLWRQRRTWLCASHLGMRKRQYLARHSSSAPGHEEALRTKLNVYEIAMDMLLWRRQVSAGFVYYCWMTEVSPKMLADVGA